MSIVSKAAPSHFPNQATRDAQPITVAWAADGNYDLMAIDPALAWEPSVQAAPEAGDSATWASVIMGHDADWPDPVEGRLAAIRRQYVVIIVAP